MWHIAYILCEQSLTNIGDPHLPIFVQLPVKRHCALSKLSAIQTFHQRFDLFGQRKMPQLSIFFYLYVGLVKNVSRQTTGADLNITSMTIWKHSLVILPITSKWYYHLHQWAIGIFARYWRYKISSLMAHHFESKWVASRFSSPSKVS